MTGSAEGWHPIKTEADWEELDRVSSGFHDGVLKDAHWSHREHVDRTGWMVYGGLPELWLLVQLQGEVRAVELRFCDVRECVLDTRYELEACMSLSEEGLVFGLSGDRGSRIAARSCEYRLAGDDRIGIGPFFPHEMDICTE